MKNTYKIKWLQINSYRPFENITQIVKLNESILS